MKRVLLVLIRRVPYFFSLVWFPSFLNFFANERRLVIKGLEVAQVQGFEIFMVHRPFRGFALLQCTAIDKAHVKELPIITGSLLVMGN